MEAAIEQKRRQTANKMLTQLEHDQGKKFHLTPMPIPPILRGKLVISSNPPNQICLNLVCNYILTIELSYQGLTCGVDKVTTPWQAGLAINVKVFY